MIFYTDNNEEHQEARKIKITIGETEYRISVNKFDELVINKHSFDDTSSITIMPSVSNEIRIL